MERIKYIILASTAVMVMASCSPTRSTSVSEPAAVIMEPQPIGGSPAAAMPKAVIYRMNGDYAQYVPVTLNASRTSLVSYPAPTDLTAQSTPMGLGDGWYLDRRGGIGPNTAFLRYTYAQYMSLPQAPDPDQLLLDIIPQARVTRSQVLPITLNKALADTALVRKYIPKD